MIEKPLESLELSAIRFAPGERTLGTARTVETGISPANDSHVQLRRKKSRRRRPYSPTRRVGRPSRYRPEIADQIYELSRLGLTDRELAERIGISLETYYAWRISYPEFHEALTRGKTEADAPVAAALYRRGIGYEYLAEMVVAGTAGSGPIVVRYVKYPPPDVGAAKAWLANRQPQLWSDLREIDPRRSAEARIAAMTPEERSARLAARRAKLLATDVDDAEGTGADRPT